MTDVASAASGVDSGSPTVEMSDNALLARGYKERQEDKSALKKNIADTESIKVPEPPKLQEMPKPEMTPMNGWGGAATFLATFGSMLTRRPLQHALDANADVMDAVNSQNMAKFKTAWDTAKIANDNAQKAAEWQMEVYKALVGKKESEARVILGSIKDDTGEKALLAKQFNAHEANLARQAKSLTENNGITYAENKVQELLKNNPNATEEEQLKAKAEGIGEWRDMVGGKEAARKAKDEQIDKAASYDWSKSKPTDVIPGTGMAAQAVKQNGESLYLGAKPSELGLGYSMSPVKKAVENYLALAHPDFNMAKAQLDYLGAKKEEAAMAARSAPAKVAVKEMDKLAQPMIDAIKKLDPSQYPDWNSVKNAYERKTGGPEVVAAALAVQEFKTAFANLMVRSGVTTDQVRTKSDELANMNFSLDQVEALVSQAKISGAAVLNALSEAKADIGTDLGGKAKPETTSFPLPAELANDPDGTKIPDASGKMWVKKGNQLVPE